MVRKFSIFTILIIAILYGYFGVYGGIKQSQKEKIAISDENDGKLTIDFYENWAIYKNSKYNFEFKVPNYFNDIQTIVFDSLPKTVEIACNEEGTPKEEWNYKNDCGWPRDYSQEDLSNWKEWIEKGVLNHPDRYEKYTLLDTGVRKMIEEKIIDVGGKKVLKRFYRSNQAPVAVVELLFFSNKTDLIILSYGISTLKQPYNSGQEFSDEEIKDNGEHRVFEGIISTLKFSK